MKKILFAALVTMVCAWSADAAPKYNVLFIISDDLTSTALSCYGNTVCKTPNIDAIAKGGMVLNRIISVIDVSYLLGVKAEGVEVSVLPMTKNQTVGLELSMEYNF